MPRDLTVEVQILSLGHQYAYLSEFLTCDCVMISCFPGCICLGMLIIDGILIILSSFNHCYLGSEALVSMLDGDAQSGQLTSQSSCPLLHSKLRLHFHHEL